MLQTHPSLRRCQGVNNICITLVVMEKPFVILSIACECVHFCISVSSLSPAIQNMSNNCVLIRSDSFDSCYDLMWLVCSVRSTDLTICQHPSALISCHNFCDCSLYTITAFKMGKHILGEGWWWQYIMKLIWRYNCWMTVLCTHLFTIDPTLFPRTERASTLLANAVRRSSSGLVPSKSSKVRPCAHTVPNER